MKSHLSVLAQIGLVILLPLSLVMAHDGVGGPKDIGNSAPPGIGGVGPYDHARIDLLGHLTLDQIGANASNLLGNDCWGWTDSATGKEYAICGLSNATSFIDISVPTDPKYLGRLLTQTGNSTWRDMKVYNNHVFVVSDGNGSHGMQVFDLTQLRTANPDNPQVFSNTAWYSGCASAHNIAINEDTGYAYIVGSNQASGGLHVVDISNPSNPTTAGNFSADGYTHDAQIVIYNGPDATYVGREICFASNEDTLTIVDVTNKNNMVQVSRTGYSQDAYTHQCWLSEDQRYVYLCDELDEYSLGVGLSRTHIWDVQDLDSPIYAGFYQGPTNAIDHNIYIKGNRGYLANYAAGLRVIDIDENDPTNLTEVAFFDTYVTDNDVDFDGAWSCFPYYDSGTVIIHDRQNGLFVVRLSPLEFNYPVGLPDLISPAGGDGVFEVEVVGFAGTPQPNSGVLHVDRGNGFESFPMNEISTNLYNGIFPSTTCGSIVRYYVSAEATDGSVINNPPNAPLDTFEVVSGDGMEVTFSDDFQTNQGWTVSGNAGDGQWQRGVPAGDGTRGDPTLDGDGSGSCYLTDNAAGNSDVDDGSTILLSPIMDGVGTGTGITSMISYYRWYSNDVGNAPASDIFVVEISNDSGESWVNLETVGPSGSEVSGGWYSKSFLISDFLTPTSEMQMRFTASDLGDGSVVEAAVDGIKIDIVTCDQNGGTVDVAPTTFDVTTGVLVSGGLSDLATSDDSDVTARRRNSSLLSIVDLEVKALSPSQTPTALSFTFEASVFARGTVNQTISLFNYDTGAFEQVDSRVASSFTDQMVEVTPTGDLTRFVEPGTDCVRAMVRFQSTKNRHRFAANIDQAIWTISF